MSIRTVLGDISTSQLGATYMHEHLIIDSEIVKNEFPHIHLPDVKAARTEVSYCKEIGVGTLVDCMPSGSGRNVKKLAEISTSTGINIIATTGMHREKYYAPSNLLMNSNVKELSQIFIDEITLGCEGGNWKCGIIKIATSSQNITNHEKRLIEAAVIAHKETGAPILTHCESGEGAIDQIALLQKLNIGLENVVLSHTDKVKNEDYHRKILESGVNVEYDQSLRELDIDDSFSASITLKMIDEGFSKQIMFGTDGARRTLWRSLGGFPGLAALYKDWSLKLGLSDKLIEQIFFLNPASFLNKF